MTRLRGVRIGVLLAFLASVAIAVSVAIAAPALAREHHSRHAHAARAAAQVCPAPTGSPRVLPAGSAPPSAPSPAGGGPVLC